MTTLSADQTMRKELYERMCGRMSARLPGWSDTLPSDPAVILLELFSELSAVQNKEINRLRPQHYSAYLALLGERPRQLAPARMLAQPLLRESLYFGMRFFVGGIPFEVSGGRLDGASDVMEVALEHPGSHVPLRGETPLILRGTPGEQVSIAFYSPLEVGAAARLWCEIAPEVGRVPPAAQTPPPVSLRCMLEQGGDWREIDMLDGTCGLLRSGWLKFTPPVSTSILRLQPVGPLEGTPRIRSITWEPVSLEQRRTRSELLTLKPPFFLPKRLLENQILRFFLPQGGGWLEAPSLLLQEGKVMGWTGEQPEVIRVAAAEPDFPAIYPLHELAMEEIALEETGILADSLRLMIEENGVWYDCPVCEPEADHTLPRGCRWIEPRGILRFGDGRDFCVPQDGRLLVAGCACTMGVAGNGAGSLLTKDGVGLQALHSASGGQSTEEPKAAFFRVAQEQEEPLRAVTCDDYEYLARRTPGLALEKVRAVSGQTLERGDTGVILLAKPHSRQMRPGLTQWQATQLRNWLERFRLLGTPLAVREPRYFPIGVNVSVSVSVPVDEDAIRAIVLHHTDGVEGPLAFGAEISHAALFAALCGISGVRTVHELELTPLEKGGRRTIGGGIGLEPDQLPWLAQFRITQI